MDAIRLDKTRLPLLRDYLNKNMSQNAIYLYDLDFQYPHKCDFDIAINSNEIIGFSVLWKDNPHFSYLHIIAEDEKSFSKLFSRHENQDDVKHIISSDNFSYIIEDKLNKIGEEFFLFNLKKEEENIKVKHKVSLLGKADMHDIRSLFSESMDIGFLNKDSYDGIMKSIENSGEREIMAGICESSCLNSFMRTSFRYPPIVMLDTLWTKVNERGRGLAESTISFLVDELFNKESFNEIQIYNSNAKKYESAIRLYKKIGFKELKKFKKYSM